MSYGLCYICDEYPPVVNVFGGLGVAFREQAEAFARRGRRVAVVCRTLDRPVGVHWINGVSVHVVRPGAIPRIRAIADRIGLIGLVSRICTNPRDLVISAEYAGPLVVKGFANQLVVQIEGSMTAYAIDQNVRVRRLARFFERRTVDLADAVTAVSRYSAERTLKTLGARPRPVHVFPNSVDAVRFRPASDEVDSNRVLFLGKLNTLKGVFVLANAMKRVFAQRPATTLTVIGADHVENGESCQRRFLDHFVSGERQRIRMLGRLSHQDVAREVRQCGVLVVPSLSDMCPLVVLEAMSCARPVVASRRGGIPEILQHGRTGLLADPDRPGTFADALVSVLTNPRRANEMGAEGRRIVLRSYTSEVVVDRLQEFYDTLNDRRLTRPCEVSVS
jgi:glycosyltransferase involved in cell wall biosynthesis